MIHFHVCLGGGGVCLLVILKGTVHPFPTRHYRWRMEAAVTFKSMTALKFHKGREFSPMAMQQNPMMLKKTPDITYLRIASVMEFKLVG